MKTKSKIPQQVLSFVMVLVTLFGTLFSNALPVHASSLALDEQTGYSYTGVSPNTGYAITHNVYVLKMDGKKVFCIESGVPANSGEGFVPEAYVSAKKDLLSKIA